MPLEVGEIRVADGGRGGRKVRASGRLFPRDSAQSGGVIGCWRAEEKEKGGRRPFI